MKNFFIAAVLAFSSASAFAVQLVNNTNETIWCAVAHVKDQLPLEVTTKGWWQINNGSSATVIPENGGLGYYCKGQSAKIWMDRSSSFILDVCVDFAKSPFAVFFANNPSECTRLGLPTVRMGLLSNPSGTVRLTP